MRASMRTHRNDQPIRLPTSPAAQLPGNQVDSVAEFANASECVDGLGVDRPRCVASTVAASVLSCARKTVVPQTFDLLRLLVGRESPPSFRLYDGGDFIEGVDIEQDVQPVIPSCTTTAHGRAARRFAIGPRWSVLPQKHTTVRIDVTVLTRQKHRPQIVQAAIVPQSANCFSRRYRSNLMKQRSSLISRLDHSHDNSTDSFR